MHLRKNVIIQKLYYNYYYTIKIRKNNNNNIGNILQYGCINMH